MIIRCAVVDDEPLALELLESYVQKTPFLKLDCSFENGVKALEGLRENPVDLLFCDIQMPGMNGVDVSRLLPPETRVIFTTAFDQYAVEGFRVNALDYLLKPISYSDFLESVKKAMTWFEMRQAAQGGTATGQQTISSIDADTDSSNSVNGFKSMFVRTDHKLQQVGLSDINFIEGMKDYVKIYLKQGKPLISQTSMKSLQSQLPSDMFYRVHRSYIVNMDNIRLIERNRIIFGEHYIPISDNERDEFFRKLSRNSILDKNP